MAGITFDQALQLTLGTTLYHGYYQNADGTPQRWRVNGRVKTWVRSPERIRVPLKRGLYEYSYLSEDCLCLYELVAEALQ